MKINHIFLILYVNALWSTMGVDAEALHIGFYGKISFAEIEANEAKPFQNICIRFFLFLCESRG